MSLEAYEVPVIIDLVNHKFTTMQ